MLEFTLIYFIATSNKFRWYLESWDITVQRIKDWIVSAAFFYSVLINRFLPRHSLNGQYFRFIDIFQAFWEENICMWGFAFLARNSPFLQKEFSKFSRFQHNLRNLKNREDRSDESCFRVCDTKSQREQRRIRLMINAVHVRSLFVLLFDTVYTCLNSENSNDSETGTMKTIPAMPRAVAPPYHESHVNEYFDILLERT